MADTLQTINIRKFKNLFPNYLETEIGDDFFTADFDLGPSEKLVEFPCRVDGYVAIYCFSGELDVDLNLKQFHIGKNTLILNFPGNIIRIQGCSGIGVHILVVAASKEFFSSISMNFNKLFNESTGLMTNPCMVLDESEVSLLGQYIGIANSIMTSNLSNRREMLGSMIASVSYLFSDIWKRNLSSAANQGRSTRANAIFEDFLHLVTEYHISQRGVGFYADKLFLTPKYLSKIVKSVSGISAPDWINSFIVLEAKNMLKYSDLTISEIVYKLNFTSQSVFYKFFKAQTGMTPSEYRKI